MIEWQDILLRLFSAAMLGGIIGFERERKDWAAGTRTHMMACMGSSLVMIVSSFGFSDIISHPNVSLDPSRVASSVVIGIGYLGAGIILVLKRGNIRGLTTASGLWATAAVGLAIGGGMYFTAVCATFIAVLILYVVQLIQKKAARAIKPKHHGIKLTIQKKEDGAAIIEKLLLNGIKFSSLLLQNKGKKLVIKADLLLSKSEAENLLETLQGYRSIQKIQLKN